MPSASKTILALALFTLAVALPTPQLAGEGQAADSIFTSIDNGIGYGIENAENNIAATISSLKGNNPQGATPAPPTTRRQLDKISNGFQAIGNSLAVGSKTSPVTSQLDTTDGDLTSGAADLGSHIGSTEESTLEDLGSSVPKV